MTDMPPKFPNPAINRRQFLSAAAAGLGASAWTAGSAPAFAAQAVHAAQADRPATATRPRRRPNLLFVFSDQQSWDMLGCYGNEDLRTPRLDRFAADGVRFQHCVSTTPVCTPYRGMLLSGLHPLYNGAISNDWPLLANNGPYLPAVLRDAGYRMGYVGKWHLLGGPRDRGVPHDMRYGFDGLFATNNCHVNYAPGECFYWTEDGRKEFFDEWEVFGQTRQALEFLDGCDDDQPFALFVSWHPPHDIGWQPGSLVRQYATIPELMELYDPDRLTLRPHVEDTPEVRHAYHGYYAMCSGVDTAFGRLMDKLEEKGLADNTLVVFSADHGDHLSSYGRTIPKCWPEDVSCRVPLLMRMPGRLPAGGVSEQLVGTLDLMPTLLGLMGLDPPATCQGTDLSGPIAAGRDSGAESVPLYFTTPAWRGVYTKEYTYARGASLHWTRPDGRYKVTTRPVDCLYARADDPRQQRNRHGHPEWRIVQQDLERQTQAWLDRFEDTEPDVRRLIGLLKGADGRQPERAAAPGFPGRPIDLIKRHNL